MKALLLLAAAYLVTGGLQPTTKAVTPQDATPWTIIDASLPRTDACLCGDACPCKAPIVEVANVAPKSAEQCGPGGCAVAKQDHSGPIRNAIQRDGDGPVRKLFHRRERGGLLRGRCRGC